MSVEVRFGDGGMADIDEIVSGQDTQVHLERMDTAAWSLILETPASRSHFSIRKKGKEVVVTTVEIDMSAGYAKDDEAAFEEWFQAERRRTFGLSSLPGERIEDHPEWSMGVRSMYWRGWMGAVGARK